MSVPERLAAALADRYRIERELGQGGMATVYLAEDVRHHRKVALKVLRPELAATLGVERFLREIEVAANLQHPHILPLFDSGEAQGFLLYVMPYIEGESLRAKLERGGELSVAESAKILRDVVDALAYAHQQGVVHRDIKPDNVLLSGRHALVTDFGVAKAVSEATGRQALTTAGVALGTPAYMAPEQAVADPHVDSRADLYAVGVMAYEMLTGHPPFTGPSPQAILAAHVTERATPIATVRHTVPGPLAQLVMQCLEKRPADRPASAEIVLPQLEALATPSGGITPTSTAPLTAVSGAAAAGRRVPRWAIGVVVVALVAGGGYALVRALRGGAGAPQQSVAVLPFENVGGDSTNQAFTDGVQDEILTDLTRIATLQVTSRTSVQEYRHTRKSVKQIGAELGVATLLEGQVQRAGNQVHVNVQLVDAARDRQVWANSYDRELTAENVFAMQGDIAQNVAHALQASLTPSQETALEKPPTTSLEALDWYHRGRTLFSARGGAIQDTAIVQAFEQAVALDSNFAEAWAGLAMARSWGVRGGSMGDSVLARIALGRAVRLLPSSPETEIAQAYYAYYAKANYDDALAHFRAVAAARPGDVDAIRGTGYILRRRGQWDQALEAERRVIALDPRDPGARWDLAQSHSLLRQFARAEREYRQALIIDPGYAAAASGLLDAIVMGQGDTARGRAALDSMPHAALFETAVAFRSVLARWGRHYAAANGATDSLPLFRAIDTIDVQITRALNDLAAGNVARARVRADSAAQIARLYLRQAPADIFGNVADFYTGLGFAEAIAGRPSEALANGERAVALNPISRDPIEGARSVEALIEIHALLGRRDDVVRLLTEQARHPYSTQGVLPLSRAVIRLDPLFDAVRKDPRVQALLANDAAWVVR